MKIVKVKKVDSSSLLGLIDDKIHDYVMRNFVNGDFYVNEDDLVGQFHDATAGFWISPVLNQNKFNSYIEKAIKKELKGKRYTTVKEANQ